MRTIAVSLFVFFLAFAMTKSAYAYWDNQDASTSADSYQIVTNHLSLEPGQTLVPVGAFKGANDVDQVIYSYSIQLQEGETVEVLIEKVTFIQNNIEYSDVFELFIFTYEVIYINDIAEITVTVQLRMPSSEEEYLTLRGSKVRFNVAFKLGENAS